MAIQFQCPHCDKALKVRDELGGKRGKCPNCSQIVQVPRPQPTVAEQQVPPAVAPTASSPPQAVAPPIAQPVPDGVPLGDPLGQIAAATTVRRVAPARASPRRRASTRARASAQREKTKSVNGLGIAALVLGILAAMTCWIPFIGLLSIPVAILGLVFGIIGFLIAIIGGKSGVGMPVSGGIVCAVALIVAILSTGGMVAAVDTVVREASRELSDVMQPIVTAAAYQRVSTGMSYDEVVRIIGHPGEELSRSEIGATPGVMEALTTVMYAWTNPDGTNMNAMFQNDELIQKAQLGLP